MVVVCGGGSRIYMVVVFITKKQEDKMQQVCFACATDDDIDVAVWLHCNQWLVFGYVFNWR